MKAAVNTLIEIFDNGMSSGHDFQEKLSQELKQCLDEDGDLQTVIRQAYRNYMDAEAPDAWLNAAERKLKTYCSL